MRVTQPPYEPFPRSHEPGLPYPKFPAQSDPQRHLPPPSKTMAGWSLGLAIFPSVITWLIAVALACSVISDSKDGRDNGKGMAVAALAIVGGWVAVAIAVVAVVFATGADRDESGRVTDGGRVGMTGLKVGDCVPEPSSAGQTFSVEVVPCTDPHRGEVFAVYDLDGEYTTQDEVNQTSDAGCLDRFKGYVGIHPRNSSLALQVYNPSSKASFDEDATVICFAFTDDPISTSLQGSKL